jgi:hypothetical protein
MSDPVEIDGGRRGADKNRPGRPDGPVWEHFRKLGKPGQAQRHSAECIYCQKVIVDGRPTYLSGHIRSCTNAPADAKQKVSDMLAEKSATTPSTTGAKKEPGLKRKSVDSKPAITDFPVSKSAKLAPGSERQIDEKLLRALVMTGLPFSIVEDPYFQDLVQSLQPRYGIPGMRTEANSSVF